MPTVNVHSNLNDSILTKLTNDMNVLKIDYSSEYEKYAIEKIINKLTHQNIKCPKGNFSQIFF